MCLKPLTIKKPNTKRKNRMIEIEGAKGNLRPLSKRRKTHVTITVPCGYCAECLSAKSTAWAVRLIEEEKNSETAYFVTLTYSEKYLPVFSFKNGAIERQYEKEHGVDYYPVLDKKDLQNMFKRIRKKNPYKNLKYYAVGEYGTKSHRPHYHIIIFNIDIDLLLDEWRDVNNQESFGNVKIGTVNPKSIRYTTNYVINKYKYASRKLFPEFAIMSKGIGMEYVAKMADYHNKYKNGKYTFRDGTKVNLPRYYKEKIFDKRDRIKVSIKNKNESIEANRKISCKIKHEDGKVKTIKLNRSKKNRELNN